MDSHSSSSHINRASDGMPCGASRKFRIFQIAKELIQHTYGGKDETLF